MIVDDGPLMVAAFDGYQRAVASRPTYMATSDVARWEALSASQAMARCAELLEEARRLPDPALRQPVQESLAKALACLASAAANVGIRLSALALSSRRARRTRRV